MKDFQIELQTTADGSTTLYRPDMDEHYHSVKGALTESQHIFIDCGLRHLAKDSLRVLEIGFGNLNSDSFQTAFRTGNRSDLGPTAPANGLTLYRVIYDDFDTLEVLSRG